MLMKVRCPHCRSEQSIHDVESGEVINCTACNRKFSSPSTAIKPDRIQAPGRREQPDERRPPVRTAKKAAAEDDESDRSDDTRAPERNTGRNRRIDSDDDQGEDEIAREATRKLQRARGDRPTVRKKERSRGIGFRILPPDDYGPNGIWLAGALVGGLVFFLLGFVNWLFTAPLLIAGLLYGFLGLFRFLRSVSEDGMPGILVFFIPPLGLIMLAMNPMKHGGHWLFYNIWGTWMALSAIFVDFPTKSPDSRPGRTVHNAPPPRQPVAFEPAEDKPDHIRGEVPAVGNPGGLIAHWAFDEGKGNNAVDASGNGRHGVIHEGKWIPGVRGTALWFDADNAWFDYGDHPAFNFAANSPFTFAGWIQTKAPDGVILVQRNRADGGSVIGIDLNKGGLRVSVREDRAELSQPAVVNGPAVNDGIWHHFALTRRPNGEIELFVDGQSRGKAAVAQSAGAITTNLRSVAREQYWLLVRRSFGTPYWNGCLDELAIFNRALTEAEIRRLAGWPQ